MVRRHARPARAGGSGRCPAGPGGRRATAPDRMKLPRYRRNGAIAARTNDNTSHLHFLTTCRNPRSAHAILPPPHRPSRPTRPTGPTTSHAATGDAGYWQDTTFFDALDAQAQRDPDALAIVDGACRLRLSRPARAHPPVGGRLRASRLTRGDAVVVHLPNGARFIETCFALFQLGVRPVLALPAHRHYEIGAFCRFAGARAYLGAAQLGNSTAARSRPRCSRPDARARLVMAGDDHAFTPFDALYDAPPLRECAAAQHRVLPAVGRHDRHAEADPAPSPRIPDNVRACSAASGFDTDTVYLAALPMAHNFTLCCPGTIGALLAGGRVITTGGPGLNRASC